MKYLSLIITFFLIVITYSCDYDISDVAKIEIKSNKKIQDKIDSLNIDQFILQYKKALPAEIIPIHYCKKYIKPALEKEELHPYLPLKIATYNFGQIEYEDKSIVVISFYYKAIFNLNILQASFLASYNKSNEEFIDSKMFFGSSLFNFQKSKGYNLGFSFRSEKRFTNKDNIIFIQNSIEKRTYSEFKKGIKRKKNSMIKRRFILYKNGKFE